MQSTTWSTKCYESSARYAWLLQEQSCIIHARKDFDVLCEGLARLPNLKRISVVDRYDGHVDFVPYIWTDSEWDFYREWSAKFQSDPQWNNYHHESFLPPSRWSNVTSDDEDTDHPWDFRGLENLLEAALLHAPKLEELLMGCDLSKLSADLFTSGGSARVLRKLAPRLTMLRADCTSCSHDYNYDFNSSIERTLNAASRLEELYLTPRDYLADWDAIFEETKWPRLRVLNLGDGLLSLSALKAFSLAHTNTLREMRLRNVYLSEPEGWTDAAEELGKILRLDFIALASMADGSIVGEPYITREITESTICRFMQWVPKGQLRLATEGGNMSLAWHVNNFLPSPTLDDFINAKQNVCVEAR